MSQLEKVTFSTQNWELREEGEDGRQWENSHGSRLTLRFSEGPPDLVAQPTEIGALRDMYRQAVMIDAGALVEVEAIELQGLPAIRTILKYPQDPSGLRFTGCLLLPKADFSFAMEITATEAEPTGTREAFVLKEVLDIELDPSEITPDGEGIDDWSLDPYHPVFTATCLRNRSDDVEWDAQFPEHPLSQVRRCLKQIEGSIEIAEDIVEAPVFSHGHHTISRARKEAKKGGFWSRLFGK